MAYVYTEIRLRKTFLGNKEARVPGEIVEEAQRLLKGWKEVFWRANPLGWVAYGENLFLFEALGGYARWEPYKGKVVPYPGTEDLLGSRGLLARRGFEAWMVPLELRDRKGQVLVVLGKDGAVSWQGGFHSGD